MSEGQSPLEKGATGFEFLPRPPLQLNLLPIRWRWEVTRRHPYFQSWWQRARDFYRQPEVVSPAEPLLRHAAIAILGGIGVGAEPPDPSIEFSDLDNLELKTAWLSGAVQPITLRGMAGRLLAMLPKESLGQIGLFAVEAACEDKSGELPRRIKAQIDLQSLTDSVLDTYVDEPLVLINPAASKRSIYAALDRIIDEYKERQRLKESRDRSENYDEYFDVWDRREGWSGGSYHVKSAQNLLQIAGELRRPLTTVVNQYRKAFQMVTGHPYSRELWLGLFGPLKIMMATAPEVIELVRKRPQKSPRTRPAPESRLARDDSGSSQPGIASSGSATDDRDLSDLLIDIRMLADKGKPADEIVKILNLDAAATELVEYVMSHADDDNRLLGTTE